MPKEQSHFALAQRAIDARHNGPLGTLIHKHALVVLAGSVAYDTPFYAGGSPAADAVRVSGEAAHGEAEGIGGDTVAPLHRLAEAYREAPSEELAALGAGLLSHRAADYIFHPLVGYFCGEDTRRHYRFEAIMDCWFRDRPRVPRRVRDVYDSVGRDFLARSLAAFFGGGTPEDLREAVDRHCRIQSLFGRPLVAAFVGVAGRVMGGSLDLHRHLFYPVRPRFAPSFFEASIHYRQPQTGEELTGSLEDHVVRYLERLGPWWDRWEAFIEDPATEPFGDFEDLSLDTVTDPQKGRAKPYAELREPIDKILLSR